MVPGPVKAVVLLYPIEESGDAKSKEEDERLQLEGQPKIDDTIFWVKQKVGLLRIVIDMWLTEAFQIPNACGTIGLIHAIANVTDILPYCCTCQTLID